VLGERGVTYEPGLGVKLFVAYGVFSFGCGPHHQRVKLREWRCWFFRLEVVLVVVEFVGGGRFADADDLHVFLKDKCTVIFYSNDTCTKKIRAYEMGMEEWWCIAVQKMQLPFIF
jgi:hypothetical protein